MSTIMISLSGVPAFLAYFGFAIALLILFGAIYIWVTPHRELALIRAGNLSAAIAFGGVLIGFALPLASAISHSVSLVDGLVWGAIALLVQIAAFIAVRLLVPGLPRQIADDRAAAGTFLAAISITVGIINAACMTY